MTLNHIMYTDADYRDKHGKFPAFSAWSSIPNRHSILLAHHLHIKQGVAWHVPTRRTLALCK
jgi:hypothetical protein